MSRFKAFYAVSSLGLIAIGTLGSCTQPSTTRRPEQLRGTTQTVLVDHENPIAWHGWQYFVRPNEHTLPAETTGLWDQTVSQQAEPRPPSLYGIVGMMLSKQWNHVMACYQSDDLEPLRDSNPTAYQEAVQSCVSRANFLRTWTHFSDYEYGIYSYNDESRVRAQLLEVLSRYRTNIRIWAMPLVTRAFRALPAPAQARYRGFIEGALEYVHFLENGGAQIEATYLSQHEYDFRTQGPAEAPQSGKIDREAQAFLYRRVSGGFPVAFTREFLEQLQQSVN